MTPRRPRPFLYALALLLGGLVAAWGPFANQVQAHAAGGTLLAVAGPSASVTLAPGHACPDPVPTHGSRGWHRASCRRLTRWLGDGALPDAWLGSIPPVPVFVRTGTAKPVAVEPWRGSGIAPRATGPRAPPAQR